MASLKSSGCLTLIDEFPSPGDAVGSSDFNVRESQGALAGARFQLRHFVRIQRCKLTCEPGEVPHILLTGHPACGKTTVVRRTAENRTSLRVARFDTQELRHEKSMPVSSGVECGNAAYCFCRFRRVSNACPHVAGKLAQMSATDNRIPP